jgi:hypothetical protein
MGSFPRRKPRLSSRWGPAYGPGGSPETIAGDLG